MAKQKKCPNCGGPKNDDGRIYCRNCENKYYEEQAREDMERDGIDILDDFDRNDASVNITKTAEHFFPSQEPLDTNLIPKKEHKKEHRKGRCPLCDWWLDDDGDCTNTLCEAAPSEQKAPDHAAVINEKRKKERGLSNDNWAESVFSSINFTNALKILAEVSDELRKLGNTKASNTIRKISKNLSIIKVAQYVGIQGYWIRNTRCWQNCYRQKRASDPGKSAWEVWDACHDEYLKSINNPKSGWEKYAGTISKGLVKIAGNNKFNKIITAEKNVFDKELAKKVGSGTYVPVAIQEIIKENSEKFANKTYDNVNLLLDIALKAKNSGHTKLAEKISTAANKIIEAAWGKDIWDYIGQGANWIAGKLWGKGEAGKQNFLKSIEQGIADVYQARGQGTKAFQSAVHKLQRDLARSLKKAMLFSKEDPSFQPLVDAINTVAFTSTEKTDNPQQDQARRFRFFQSLEKLRILSNQMASGAQALPPNTTDNTNITGISNAVGTGAAAGVGAGVGAAAGGGATAGGAQPPVPASAAAGGAQTPPVPSNTEQQKIYLQQLIQSVEPFIRTMVAAGIDGQTINNIRQQIASAVNSIQAKSQTPAAPQAGPGGIQGTFGPTQTEIVGPQTNFGSAGSKMIGNPKTKQAIPEYIQEYQKGVGAKSSNKIITSKETLDLVKKLSK